MPVLGEKAKEAQVLVQRLRNVANLEERRVYAKRLDELFPDIRVRLDEDGRAHIWYLHDKVIRLPHVLGHFADYIEVVFLDGSAEILKNKIGNIVTESGFTIDVGPIRKATIELAAFDAAFDLPPGPNMWERLVDEDQF